MKAQLLFILLFFLLFQSCIKKEKDNVNIGLLNGPSSLGMIYAIEEETYHEGSKVHYQIKDNPQHLRALLQSGNMDMAILPMTLAYGMIENNIDIKIFAVTGWGNLFVLSRDSIENLLQVDKCTISVPGEGQTPDLVSKFLIDYLGIQDKVSLNYTYPAPILLASALAVGKVEYAVLPEPLASLALSKDSTLQRSVNIAELWNKSLPEISLVQSVFVVRGAFYEGNKDWFDSYANALEVCADKAILMPDSALQLAVNRGLLPQNTFDASILENSRLDFARQANISHSITQYLNTFYSLDKNFNIDNSLILKQP